MKKVITILAILVVLTSAVFAETHKLTVKTVVADVTPSFQLRYGTDGVYTNATADSNSIDTQSYPGQYGVTEDLTVTTAIDLEQDISTGDVTADFYAVLAVGGKQKNKTYKLTFTAGAFNTTNNGAEDLSPCTESAINKVLSDEYAEVVVTDATTGNENEAVNSQFCTVTMKGAPAEEKIDLVKFSALWARNKDVDVGEYTADITLLIELQN